LASSGDSNLAELLESIRVEERLPALAAGVIIDGDIYVAAAVGTRKFGSENWVTVNDSFLIASCSKAFTATLAAILIENGVLTWNTTLGEAYPDLDMRKKSEINGKIILKDDVLKKLHTPPNNASWREDAEENGYGVPSLNYALGWYTLDIGGKKGLLWHPGGNTGFIAQVIMDPNHNNAIMVVTNVREKHEHLFQAMSRIREYYSDIADLPEIK
jgi:CubicO group peptidase (beta-lactamase class C family)